ncbi:histidinol-phosphate transaminase [Micromonospora sp. DT48]|uniref:histidinol-phosphate transaminase n=1 Tax=unclassified Micromonospora TaxID=2617518 RepID=UPI0013241C46|nr:histidinol-phosphate transaminase [Micromonospora sp. CP22]MTK03966.1 histidinol-phosphate transaminase [Micromonospora sp. CP22]
MDDIVSLVRPEIYAMRPYSSARVEADQAVRIHLDANENPYPPYPGGSEQEGLNRYPEPQPPSLLRRFSEIYGLPVEQLFLSRGADEAIDLLVRAFCAAGRDAILITPPTFVMYETAAHIQGASVRQVPLLAGSYQLDTDAMLAACDADPGIKIVFVCSPNNPTANLMEHASVLRLAERLRGRAMVVVDELYLDYSGRPSLAGAIAEQPNLVVVRSLSKEYSLAGERCGITLAHPEVVGVLRRIMPPYPLTVTAIRAIGAAISPDGIAYGRRNIDRIVAERDRVREALAQLPTIVEVLPSDANFLLVRTEDPRRLCAALAAQGIRLRDRSGVIDGAVRLSIGTPEENDELLRALKLHG